MLGGGAAGPHQLPRYQTHITHDCLLVFHSYKTYIHKLLSVLLKEIQEEERRIASLEGEEFSSHLSLPDFSGLDLSSVSILDLIF